MKYLVPRAPALLALLLPLAACRGCGQKAAEPESLEQLLPRRAEEIIFAPRLGAAFDQLRLLAGALAQVPQGELLGQAIAEISAQLSGGARPEALLESLGLDRTRPMAVVVLESDPNSPQLWLALPVKDRPLLEGRVGKLAASRLGAREESGTHGGKRYLRQDGAVAAALRFDDRAHGTALLAIGAHADALLDDAAGLTADATLARSPDYQACRRRWSDMDLWIFMPEGGAMKIAAPGFKPERGSGIAFAFGKEGISARAVALLTTLQATFAGALAVPARGEANALLGLLAPSAPLWLALNVDPAPLAGDASLSKSLPAPLSSALQAANIDPREVLENVGPELVLSVGLSEQPSFRVMPSLDPRESNPFSFLVLRAAVEVRNPDQARATLAKIAAAGPRYGVTYTAGSVSGVPVQTASYSQGESVSLALVDRTLLVTGGSGEMERALAALRSPTTVPPFGAKSVAALRLDVPTLLTQVDALPAQVFGGFAGLTVRSLVTRLISPMAHFGRVDATARLDSDAVIAELKVPLR